MSELRNYIPTSVYRRLKTVRGDDWWVNEKAPPNGIGPICLFCNLLIDWGPTDHAPECPVRRFLGVMYDDE